LSIIKWDVSFVSPLFPTCYDVNLYHDTKRNFTVVVNKEKKFASMLNKEIDFFLWLIRNLIFLERLIRNLPYLLPFTVSQLLLGANTFYLIGIQAMGF
jgi:hypothetical protein